MTVTENTENQDFEKKKKKRLWVGRVLSGISLLLSIALGIWQAWLIPITDKLAEQGRMHEGDSDGCFYGLLLVLTIFISPVVTILSILLGGLGFHFRARTLAILAWIAALATLIPMLPVWRSFFGW